MNKIIKGIVITGVVVLALYGAVIGFNKLFSSSNLLAGDAYTGFPNGITVGGGTYAASPALKVAGTLNVTTSNTATSTLVVGCIQFYATSTATALIFQASTTPGVMYSQYGTCPNL